jgi:hypothetical protein
LVECWQTLLQSVVVDSEARVSSIPILSEREVQKQLVQFNQTEKPYPLIFVHRQFERAVE